MVYLLIATGMLAVVWMLMKKRQLASLVMDCRDYSYLRVFEAETLASERGKIATELYQGNPRVAFDREQFINICYSSGVKPDLAAQAWVNRVLDGPTR